MNSHHSDIAGELETIGQLAYLDTGETSKSFFMYVVCEEGAVSVSLFFRPWLWGKIRYARSSLLLKEKCYDLWQKMKKNGETWSLLCLNVIQGKTHVEFVYKDSFDSERDRIELRTELLLKYLGTAKVEYPPL